MILPDPLNVDSLEAAYLDWNPSSTPILRLPTSLPQPLPFCVEGALLQFIASASRRTDDGLTIEIRGLLREDPNYATSLKNAIGNTHVLCGWMMANRFVDGAGHAIPKSESHVYSQYLDAMDTYEFMETHATRQTRVNLICVQGAKREFVQPLYHEVAGKKVIRPVPDVRLFVQDILSQLASNWTGKQIREVSAPLAQLVKELMENADWWARTDAAGNLYKAGKSFRVLSFRMVDIDDDNAAIFGGANHHLHTYLSTILLEQGNSDGGISSSRQKSIKRHTFLEITVVDSGPGLARRWLSSREENPLVVRDLGEISLEDERKAVTDCFAKWATSSHNSARGIGLFSVARMLQEQNGFLRLRTGRLAYLFGTKSATKDVQQKAQHLGEDGKASQHVLEDGTQVFMEDHELAFFLRPWNKGDLGPVEGTSYSILLPVRA
ncbi:hypothetical protein [Pseudoduganella sp. R-34]|uniref:hypothetical protein n=1 Tax=Pseudoduganella sp. R-34 TaxID=3404062 RepID=UPI003CE7C11D